MSKAILLLSGGLDSTLAGKMLMQMDIDVLGLNYTSPFCQCTPSGLGCSAAVKAAKQVGIKLKIFPTGEEYLEIIKHPRFGRGSGVNPCLDCRIYIFKQAKKLMLETGADFVVTGEVLGERPMSQRRNAMEIIERESDLEGLIVRPLCAKLFPPSLPEQKGLLDREKLLSIQGRCRKPQMQLAEDLGLTDYLCPAGGCLLTEKEFAARFRDMLKHNIDFDMAAARRLRHGRHFRLPSRTKLIVGRNEKENEIIERFALSTEKLLLPADFSGPSILCSNLKEENDIRIAAGIMLSYAKVESGSIEERKGKSKDVLRVIADAAPLPKEQTELWRISASKK